MNCQELLDLLHDYISGELQIEKHRSVELHLSGCPRCVTLVETYRYTIKLGRALPKFQKLPADVESRLRQVLDPYLKCSDAKRAEGSGTPKS